MKTLARLVAAVASVALAGTLAACGAGSTPTADARSSTAPTTVNTAAQLYNELPQRIKDQGLITVGSSIEYAPMEYYDTDGKTVLGFDKEFGDLLSQQLGVPLDWNNSKFDGLITQLNSGRFDMLSSAMTDNPERQQSVDFVDYYQAGKTDLLVTWLYKLTVNQQDYNLASAIGIIIFLISAILSLIVYNLSSSAKKEDAFQ